MQVVRKNVVFWVQEASIARVSVYGIASLVLSSPVVAQERISLGAPAAGSRLDLLRRLGDLVREAFSPAVGARGILLLAAAGLAYGVLHALGPGHQKTLIAGTLLSEGGGKRGLVAAAGVAAASHAAAVLLFGLVFFGLERVLGGGGTSYSASGERWRTILTKLSAAALVLLATRSLILRIRQAVRRCGAREAEGEAQTSSCGHRHTGESCGEEGSIGRRSLATIATGSLAPCPGALLFLFMGLSAGNAAAGVLAVVAVSAGMFLTLLAFGGMALVARRASLRKAIGRDAVLARRVQSALEIGGAALVLVFALALLC